MQAVVPRTDLPGYQNLGLSLNPMNWIGEGKEEIKETAFEVMKWGTIILLGIGVGYIVIKDPRVIGKWARAVGTQKAVAKSVKAGSDAVQIFPNIMGVS